MSEYNKTSNYLNWVYFTAGIILLAVIIFWVYNTVFSSPSNKETALLSPSIIPVDKPQEKPEIQEIVKNDIPKPGIPEKIAQPISQSEEKSIALPGLDDSDKFARDQLIALNNSTEFLYWLQSPQLLQRWITVIDGLSKGNLIRGIVSIETPKSKFPIIKQGERYFLDDKGFDRFDNYVQLIQSVSPVELANTFHFLRPLVEEAYGLLGEKPEDVDKVIIKALDNVLKAPVYPGDVELLTKSVNYQFADRKIESLSQLDKLMIRMGPNHTASLQKYARELKAQLVE